jgi:DNA polymerase-3 subunit epsilon
MTDFDQIEKTARTLEANDDFRVLRRIGPSSSWRLRQGNGANRKGLYVDVETTGLDLESDEIIEVALLPFEYDLNTGHILRVCEDLALNNFCDPGIPIPAETSQIHGITDDMVAGKSVDEPTLKQLVSHADLLIAHNAAFDRPMLERVWPCFEDKAWACSLVDINWRSEGFGAGKLDYLLMQQGWFFDGHRALSDCIAGIFLLNLPLPQSNDPAMHSLLKNARKQHFCIRAVGAPFEMKDSLRKRGYRWDPGDPTREKSWWTIVEDEKAELAWLQKNIYERDVQLPIKSIQPSDRFSKRIF